MRLEMASFRGRPVYFNVVWPWTRPLRMETRPETAIEKIGRTLDVWLFLVLLAACGYAGLRNMRRGRSDFRGAVRLGAFLLVISVLGWALAAHHVPDTAEMGLFTTGLALAVFVFGLAWLFYVAIEPYVRRLMPDRIITWVRLVGGRFRDPLVGRDILIGCLLGGLMTVVFKLRLLVPVWFGQPASRPDIAFPPLALPAALAAYLQYVLTSIFNSLVILCFILFLRVILRKHWIAVGGVFVILVLIITPAATGSSPVDFAATALFTAIFLLALLRYGLLAMVACFFASITIQANPLTFTAWHSGTSILAHLILATLAVYAFVISLGGKPMFRDAVLDG
jgi:serine/threonine-protein kinase